MKAWLGVLFLWLGLFGGFAQAQQIAQVSAAVSVKIPVILFVFSPTAKLVNGELFVDLPVPEHPTEGVASIELESLEVLVKANVSWQLRIRVLNALPLLLVVHDEKEILVGQQYISIVSGLPGVHRVLVEMTLGPPLPSDPFVFVAVQILAPKVMAAL
jgi:hypothetical protein